MLLQTILVWAALSGAVFSSSAMADDASTVEWSSVEILRGDAVKRYEPPLWFSRRVTSTQLQVLEPESFFYDPPKVSSSMGRPPKIGPEYACKKANGTWVYCD